MNPENQVGESGLGSAAGMGALPGMSSGPAEWTFLSNYAHVLVCVARDPQVRMRDVAARVGITERAVQRIVSDLMEAGYLRCEKLGRRNRYHLDLSRPLRHPLEGDCAVGELMSLFLPRYSQPAEPTDQ